MTLIDSGPLIALVNKRDPYHQTCFAASRALPPTPLLTTWPCITEAMYFLYQEVGYMGQHELWRLIRKGSIRIHSLSEAETDRMAALMDLYQDIPMDLADASLVVLAETLSQNRIFTIDSHFRAYRIGDTGVFDIIPRSL